MNYSQTIQYLFSKLPMYHRIGAPAFNKDLTNTIALCDYLDNPPTKFRSIHVAGTNGKGSVSHMLDSVLQEAGYKTGLYTSPHLTDFRERIRINGKMVSESFVIHFTEKIKPLIEKIKPSFFEITVAMAFEAFARERVDVGIVETGLGGRLDSTNVINPDLSIITNISQEHQQFLGNSLKEIAWEKAGIIKTGKPVLIGKSQIETRPVFQEAALDKDAPLFFASDICKTVYTGMEEKLGVFEIQNTLTSAGNKLYCDLHAAYQAENINTLEAFYQLFGRQFNLNRNAFEAGLKKIKTNTGLQGRWECISQTPRVIVDIAHNPDAISNMARQLEYENFSKLFILYGCSSDKESQKVLKQLPANAKYYFARPDVPRGKDAAIVAGEALNLGIKGMHFDTVPAAIKSILPEMTGDDMLLITGSAFVVADALAYFEEGSTRPASS